MRDKQLEQLLFDSGFVQFQFMLISHCNKNEMLVHR